MLVFIYLYYLQKLQASFLISNLFSLTGLIKNDKNVKIAYFNVIEAYSLKLKIIKPQ